jgi:hypothetical protein
MPMSKTTSPANGPLPTSFSSFSVLLSKTVSRCVSCFLRPPNCFAFL